MTITPPAGFENGMLVSAASNGKLALQILTNGVASTSIELNPEEVGRFVVQLLSVSAAAHAASGNQPAPPSARKGVSVEPTAIGLSQSPRKGYEILAVRCGNAEFGLSIPHATLRNIGTAMIAASASGEKN